MARSAPAVRGHHNLPIHATALVGRDREVADLRQLLIDNGRLVTLTGVGGCGKTRLALGVACSLIGSFKDGIRSVELAALADPQLVPQAVASVFGVRERSDRSLLDALVAHLARRQVLLVLDNCEHLVKVCAELADTLLHGCPGVRVLATSREALHIPLLRQADDPWPLHAALADGGWIALNQGDYRASQAHFDEALAVARAAGDRVSEAIALHNLGWLALQQEDSSTAYARSEASLALARAVGDTWIVSGALHNLANVMLRQGHLANARRLAEESLILHRQIGEHFQLAHCLDVVGQVAMADGHYDDAREAFRESLHLRRDLSDRAGLGDTLESIAALAAAETQSERAVQLAGAAAAIREQVGAPPSPRRRSMLDHWLGPARQALGAETTGRAWETGRGMAAEQALDLAVAVTEAPTTRSSGPPERSAQQVAGLSPREREVAALLALGLSNRQIAQRLVVTERTVGAHIEHILDKTGFASRHQVGVWADEHGLLG